MAYRELMIAIPTAVLTSVITVTGTVWIGTLDYFNKNRALDIEMVRISLEILETETKDTSSPGREFALRALAKYSGVDIPEDQMKLWITGGKIPHQIKDTLVAESKSQSTRSTGTAFLLGAILGAAGSKAIGLGKPKSENTIQK